MMPSHAEEQKGAPVADEARPTPPRDAPAVRDAPGEPESLRAAPPGEGVPTSAPPSATPTAASPLSIEVEGLEIAGNDGASCAAAVRELEADSRVGEEEAEQQEEEAAPSSAERVGAASASTGPRVPDEVADQRKAADACDDSAAAPASSQKLVERRYAALYCTPCEKVPGELSLRHNSIDFEPRTDAEALGRYRAEEYRIHLEVRDLLECGAVAMPIEGLASAAQFGSSTVAFFLQLHVRTLDGCRFLSRDELAAKPWRVLLRLETRDALYEAAQVLLDAMDSAKQHSSTEAITSTCVPFACSDCMAELEAAARPTSWASASQGAEGAAAPVRRGVAVRRQVPAAPPSAAEAAAFAAAAAGSFLRSSWQSFFSGPPSSSSSSAPGHGRRRRRDAAQEQGEQAEPQCRLERVVLRPENTPPGQTLLTRALAELIADFLPVSLRTPGAVEWVLRYTPKAHGVSMSTLYRNLAQCEKSVVVVTDTEGRIFGGFAPEPWEPRSKFYGSGEAFVFFFDGTEELRFFPWATTNSYFMYSDFSVLAMGGGDGRHAFAIRSDLLHGSSSPTSTFGNPVLAASEDFVVRDVELWALTEVES